MKVGNKGIQYLTKADLPSLRLLSIFITCMVIDALRTIVKANWPKMEYIYFDNQVENASSAYSLKGFAKQYRPIS